MEMAQRALSQDAVVAARELLGWTLTYYTRAGEAGGLIVETEAYRAADDPACHGFRGPTPRSQMLWEAPGTIYVYRSYGLHNLLNLVVSPPGVGAAVLIRALEPTLGLELMALRRGAENLALLASGPARLTQALGVTLELNGAHLRDGVLQLRPPAAPLAPEAIVQTTRIGITQGRDLPWRFYLDGNPHVSRPGNPIKNRS